MTSHEEMRQLITERLLTLDEASADAPCRVHHVRRCTICLVDDEPDRVTEDDIDWAAEDRAAEEQWIAQRESDWEVASCCGGRNWYCTCYGHGRMTMKDYWAKYGGRDWEYDDGR